MSERDLQAELAAIKAREISHLALIQDYRKGLKLKNELLRECEKAINKAIAWHQTGGFTPHGIDELPELLKKLREGKK